MPLFSVITVTRNNLDGLRRTYHSLQNQSCRDFEWIVIDGNSSDGTQQFLAQTDASWASEPDSGIYDAMNKGIEKAGGGYLLFLNAGDSVAANTTLETVKTALSPNRPGFVYGDSLESGFPKRARFPAALAWGMFTHHQAMLYSRAALGLLRYNPAYPIAADYDLTCRLLQQKPKILYIPEPLCIFESGGISQQKARQGRREQAAIRSKLGLTGPARNLLISCAQGAVWNARRLSPPLYWLVKSSGNRRPGSAQNEIPPRRRGNQA